MSNKLLRLAAVVVVALLAMVALLAPLNNTGSIASAQGQVTLRWYVRDEPLEQEWQDQMIQAFQSSHPTITIELMVVPDDEFDARLNGMWLQSDPPDVWSPNHATNGFKHALVKGWVADLSPFITGSNPLDLGDFLPETVEMYTVDGRVYGLPILGGGSFLFYNRNLLDAAEVPYPPTDWDDPIWTWDAMVAKAISLTQNRGDPENVLYGVTTGLALPWGAYAWLWGQDLFPPSAYQTGFATESYLDTPTATLAYQARQDLICKYRVSPSPSEAEGFGGWYGNVFLNERTAMVATGVWGLWAFRDAGFDWGFAALPKGTPGATDVVYTDPWAMSSATGHPAEAWEFLKFLVSQDAQRAYTEITNAPPVRQSLMPEWSAIFSDTMTIAQVQQVYAGALAHGAESPNHLMVDYNEIHSLLEEELNPLWENCETSVTDTLASVDVQLEDRLAWIIEMNTVPTATLDLDTGGDVASNDGVGTLEFGAGTVSETTVVSLTSEDAVFDSPSLFGAGGVLQVEAMVSGTGETVTRTNIPYTMTVDYDRGPSGDSTDRSVMGMRPAQEGFLAIYWWDPVLEVWEREMSSQVDAVAGVVRARPTRFGLFAVLQAANVTKRVTPDAPVNHGDLLTYTLTIMAAPGTELALYDPLAGTTWIYFVEQPTGVTHVDTVNGTLYLGGAVTGTLMVTPTDQVTVSFVVRVGVPGTVGGITDVTNRACVYPFGGTLGGCIWSNDVTNVAFHPYGIYLPLVMRNS